VGAERGVTGCAQERARAKELQPRNQMELMERRSQEARRSLEMLRSTSAATGVAFPHLSESLVFHSYLVFCRECLHPRPSERRAERWRSSRARLQATGGLDALTVVERIREAEQEAAIARCVCGLALRVRNSHETCGRVRSTDTGRRAGERRRGGRTSGRRSGAG
jgi:hypothetical protein